MKQSLTIILFMLFAGFISGCSTIDSIRYNRIVKKKFSPTREAKIVRTSASTLRRQGYRKIGKLSIHRKVRFCSKNECEEFKASYPVTDTLKERARDNGGHIFQLITLNRRKVTPWIKRTKIKCLEYYLEDYSYPGFTHDGRHQTYRGKKKVCGKAQYKYTRIGKKYYLVSTGFVWRKR